MTWEHTSRRCGCKIWFWTETRRTVLRLPRAAAARQERATHSIHLTSFEEVYHTSYIPSPSPLTRNIASKRRLKPSRFPCLLSTHRRCRQSLNWATPGRHCYCNILCCTGNNLQLAYTTLFHFGNVTRSNLSPYGTDGLADRPLSLNSNITVYCSFIMRTQL